MRAELDPIVLPGVGYVLGPWFYSRVTIFKDVGRGPRVSILTGELRVRLA